MASEAQKRANAKYDAAHTKGLYLKLNLESDAAIIAWLEEVAQRDPVKGKQGYIKDLIKADMNNEQMKGALQ